MNFKVLSIVFLLILAGMIFMPAKTKAEHCGAFVVPKGQTQAFLDDELIASKENVVRVWHKLNKHPNNPLIEKSIFHQKNHPKQDMCVEFHLQGK